MDDRALKSLCRSSEVSAPPQSLIEPRKKKAHNSDDNISQDSRHNNKLRHIYQGFFKIISFIILLVRISLIKNGRQKYDQQKYFGAVGIFTQNY